MAEKIVTWFTKSLLGKIPKELIIFLVSMLPIVELRGGLIAAPLLNIPIVKAVVICVIGNLIPIPFILYFITPIFKWLKKTKLFAPMVQKIEEKSLAKSDKIQKYTFWGLMLFVGVPLPGTGAWTGSLIAVLLGIEPKRAIPPIMLGLLMATAIMCTFTYFVPWLISLI